MKLRDDIDIPYEDAAERFLAPLVGPAWVALTTQFPFLTLEPARDRHVPPDILAIGVNEVLV